MTAQADFACQLSYLSTLTHPTPTDPSHTLTHSPTGPPPDPDTVEAAKPREHRDWRKLLGEDNKPGYGQGQGQQQGHKRQR